MRVRDSRAALAFATALLASCAPPPPPAPVESSPPGFPCALYQAASRRNEPVFVVDDTMGPGLVLRVYRAGSLARLGHDHVVSTAIVRGFALIPEDLSHARIDLYLPVDQLRVDEPNLRREAGFTTEPTDADIEGTRSNMLNGTLESARFPFVVFEGVCAPVADCAALDARITLHGVTRSLRIPVTLERDSRRVVATGRFQVLQSDFGITAYSALGGALRVADQVDVEFRFVLRPPLMPL